MVPIVIPIILLGVLFPVAGIILAKENWNEFPYDDSDGHAFLVAVVVAFFLIGVLFITGFLA